jgi:hypothetical protein
MSPIVRAIVVTFTTTVCAGAAALRYLQRIEPVDLLR